MNKIIIRIVICIVLIVMAIVLFSVGFRHIQDGYMGVEISVVGKERVLPNPLRAGWYWRRPLMVDIETYPINELSEKVSLRNVLDRNKKWMDIESTVYYQLKSDKLVDLHKKYNNYYDIASKVKSFFEWKIKATLSEFTREEVFGEDRQKLIMLMTKRMKDSFEQEGIAINEVVIGGVSFPRSYSEDINNYPTTSTPVDVKIDCNTSDKQRLTLSFKVYHHIDSKNAERVHNTLGAAYKVKSLEPTATNVISRVTTLYPLDDIYNGRKRAKVEDQIEKDLREQMSETGIEIDQVMITSVNFDAEYQKHLDQIQAERRYIELTELQDKKAKILNKREDEARARKRRHDQEDADDQATLELKRAEGQRKAEITRAEGKAEALLKVQKIIAENPDILRYLYIDKISDKVKVIVMPGNGNLNIESLMNENSDK